LRASLKEPTEPKRNDSTACAGSVEGKREETSSVAASVAEGSKSIARAMDNDAVAMLLEGVLRDAPANQS
jgi:hypothetical protein